MLCASCSRSPSALVFLTLSLPARSQLEAKNKIIINLWDLRTSVRSGWSWKGVINLSRWQTFSAVKTGAVTKFMTETNRRLFSQPSKPTALRCILHSVRFKSKAPASWNKQTEYHLTVLTIHAYCCTAVFWLKTRQYFCHLLGETWENLM